MNFKIGIKSDPIEYRYSFEWLFRLMRQSGVRFLQLGSFSELYTLEDGYFRELRDLARTYDISIKSVFTAHRELGGFFTGNAFMEKVARSNYERLIEVAALLGADYVGSNPGAVYRDRPETKASGIRCYLRHLKELMYQASDLGLKGLSVEPMSCSAEPPSFPQEIEEMMSECGEHHAAHRDSTVPVFLCGDISHGVADRDGKVLHDNMELFEFGIPWMCEFHIKNTDAMFGSTFGFTAEDRVKGIVDLGSLERIIRRNASRWPVDDLVGYLEIGGPKLGRDYSDHLLEYQLAGSLEHIQEAMAGMLQADRPKSGPATLSPLDRH